MKTTKCITMTTVASAYTFLIFTATFLAGNVMAGCDETEVKACLALTTKPTGSICLSNAAKLQKCAAELTCTSADDVGNVEPYTDQLIVTGFAEAFKFICNGYAAIYGSSYPCLVRKGLDPANIIDKLYAIEECIDYKTFVNRAYKSALSCGVLAAQMYAKAATRIANPLVSYIFVDNSCKLVWN